MKLKTVHQSPNLLTITQKKWESKSKLLFRLLKFMLGLFALCFIFMLGSISSQQNIFQEILMPVAVSNIKIIPNLLKGTSTANPKTMVIDIKHQDFLKLAYNREQALKANFLFVDEESYVPATVSYNGQTAKVSIRLKGDHTDHLHGDKWSFRIKTKQDNTLANMKQFSIHHPKTRKYIHEWIFHQALKREGVLSLRYQFINVTLNGKDLGIYALEEHFEKRLIEHNNRREGPIVRFNEDLFWATGFLHENVAFIQNRQQIGTISYLASDIDTFQTSKLLANPIGYAQYIQAVNLLEAFRRGHLKASQVFDIEKLTTYLAISELTGNLHSVVWHNLRFYYNPITARLEPIGFDGSMGAYGESMLIGIIFRQTTHSSFLKSVFEDDIMLETYLQTLNRISESTYIEELLLDIDKDLQNNLNILYKEFPYFSFSIDYLYNNQQFIQSFLNPKTTLQAYYSQATPNYITLNLINNQTLPIKILSVSYKDSFSFYPTQKTTLTTKTLSDLLQYHPVSFALPANFTWSTDMIADLKVNYQLLGINKQYTKTVLPSSKLRQPSITPELSQQNSTINEFDFIIIDETTKKIFIKPGLWKIDKDLIIPAGYTVVNYGNTSLNLVNQAKIISYSALNFSGNEENPFTIQSTDATGQGLMVINVQETSFLEHVVFTKLTNPNYNSQNLLGAVTFYNAPLRLSHTQFFNNFGEDALTVISSTFSINHTQFGKTTANAFNSNASIGEIANSSFTDNGKNSINLINSQVELQDIIISNSNNIGINAIQNSHVNGSNIEINQVNVAVASIDISRVIITNLLINHASIGLTAYQEQVQFGPAFIDVTTTEMNNVDTPYLVEVESKIIDTYTPIQAKQENIKDLFIK